MLGFRHQTSNFSKKQKLEMCFSPRGSVWSVEGWILLRISLGLAVRSFWNDLEKFPKWATGQTLGHHFSPGTLLYWKIVPEKMVLWRNDFVVEFQGNPSCPNEFYGPWDPYGQATLPRNLLKKSADPAKRSSVLDIPLRSHHELILHSNKATYQHELSNNANEATQQIK